jgi:hypothetical protein
MDMIRELSTDYNEGLRSAELLKPKANAEMNFSII